MNSASLRGKSVRELQELAQRGAPPARPRRKGLSRAARLHLIDILSRRSGPALALAAGVGVYLAVTAGRAFPVRATVWALMLLAALWACRRLRGRFRSGAAFSARPFHWRASFTASLSVLGVVLASAPVLLTPAGAPDALAAQVLALAITAGFAAALFMAAHLPSAAALALPSAIFAALAGVRAQDPGLIAACVAASTLGLSGLYAASRYLEKSAARRYPRTTLIRREVERQQTRIASSTPSDRTAQA